MAFNLGDILVSIKANTDGLKQGISDVQNMGEQTKTLGSKIQTGLNVAAAGLAVVGAGLTIYAKKATDFTQDLVSQSKALGVTIGVSTEEASRLVAAVGRMGISAQDATQMFGIFSKQIVASTTSNTANQLASQKLQIQIDQTKASIKATTDEIAKNGDATGDLHLKLMDLNNTLLTQQNAQKQSADSFQKLGISTVDASGKQKDFNTLLDEVADKFKAMPDGVDKTTIAMDLFGRSGKDMIKTLNLGSDGIADLEKKADALGLTLNAKTVGAIANLVASQKDLKEQQDAMKISVGTLTAPILTAWNKGLLDVMQTIMNVNPAMKTITANVLAFGGPVASGASAVLAFGANLDQAIPALKTFVLTLGPWVIALALIAVAIYGLIQQMGGWKQVMKDLQPEITKVKDFLNTLKDDAIKGLTFIKGHLDDVYAAMKLIVTGDFKGGIFGLTEDSPAVQAMLHVHNALEDIWTVMQAVGGFIASSFMPVVNTLIAVFEFLWPSIEAVFSSLWDRLLPALQSIWDAVTRLWNALNPALIDVLEVIGVIIGVVLVGAIWLAINILNVVISVFSFFIGIIADVIGWVANLASWIGTAFAAIGNALAGVIIWFSRLPGEAANAINGIIGWFAGLPGRIAAAVGGLGNALGGAWDGMKNGFKSALNWIIDQANKLIRAYNNSVGKLPGTPNIGQIAQFAKGTENFAGGGAIVGEQGPELGLFPSGTKIVPAGLTANLVDNLMTVGDMLKTFISNGASAYLGGSQVNGGAAAAAAQPLTQNTNIYGDINIGSQQDADYLLSRMDRNYKLENMGLSPA